MTREIAAFGGVSLALREREVSILGVTDRRTNKHMGTKSQHAKKFLFVLQSDSTKFF